MPLKREMIIALWDKRAMYIVWEDGSDSMCQDNDYSLDYILKMHNEGCKVYLD